MQPTMQLLTGLGGAIMVGLLVYFLMWLRDER